MSCARGCSPHRILLSADRRIGNVVPADPLPLKQQIGGRRADRVIPNLVLATVSLDQGDPHESIAACAVPTV